MGLHKPGAFAKICHVGPSAVSMAVTRGQLVKSGDYIDDLNAMNAAWKTIQLINAAAKGININQPAALAAPNVAAPAAQRLAAPNVGSQSADAGDDAASPLEIANLKVEGLRLYNKKTAEEIEKLQIQNAKANGEVIPTELAQSSTIQLAKTMATAYKDAAEDLLTRLAKRYNMSNTDLATERGNLINTINTATDEGIEAALAMLDSVAEEFAVKRGVGEHN